jgi:hypothetical protein
LLQGTNHGRITTNQSQRVIQCNGDIPVHLVQQKGYGYAIGWVLYTYRVLGFPGSIVSPFSEA